MGKGLKAAWAAVEEWSVEFATGRSVRDRRRGRLVRSLLVMCLVAPVFTLPADAATPQGQFEECLLDRINHERARNGAPALQMAWDRVFAVRSWSRWMRFNTFRHMTSAERRPILPPRTSTWAENIAMHSGNLADCGPIHDMFMRSAGHRANRLNASMQFVALGVYRDHSGWWVTELFFAAPGYPSAPAPPGCPSGRECDTVVLQDAGGRFEIRQGISTQSVRSFYFGNPGDIAFSGDWDCDGTDTLGLYRQSDGYVYLRNTNTQGVADVTFYFGNPGDVPIAGDFNGDGCDTVSIYRPSESRFYIINRLGSRDRGLGRADYSFQFGNPGDKPFVGDFNGDEVDTIGLHRESTGLVYFRNSNTTGVAHAQFVFGNPGDRLVAGDWDGNGVDTVGVYRPSNGMFYLKRSNSSGAADWQLFVDETNGVVVINQ